MINKDFFKDKQVTIVGLARSGMACARLLNAIGAKVRITDSGDTDGLRRLAEELRAQQIRVELGGHSGVFLKGTQILVISPGVADTALPVQWAFEEKITVLGEIECAFRLCPAQVVAVTGSTGKTTVTTLIASVLKRSGRRVFVCGNIGTPFCEVVSEMEKTDFVSLEVSSFQLEHCLTFKPAIAVVLNCSPNHLDRYASMRDYINAKKRIFMNQNNEDTLVLNADDPEVRSWGNQAKSRVLLFRADEKNNQNAAAVTAVADALGIEETAVKQELALFKGIEHRLESVDTIDGVKFINDSKATTLESALWALGNIEGPIILIAGGKHKGIDYTGIREPARRKVKLAVLIGQAREMIKTALEGAVPVEYAADLPEAVRSAFKQAQPADTVLLSPMCSSFDMFANYEERGRVFKEAVRDLARTGSVKERHGAAS